MPRRRSQNLFSDGRWQASVSPKRAKPKMHSATRSFPALRRRRALRQQSSRRGIRGEEQKSQWKFRQGDQSRIRAVEDFSLVRKQEEYRRKRALPEAAFAAFPQAYVRRSEGQGEPRLPEPRRQQ